MELNEQANPAAAKLPVIEKVSYAFTDRKCPAGIGL